MFSLLFSGCSADRYSKDLICDNLCSSYTAKADFIFSDGEKGTEGLADIVKSDVTTVTFTQPESLSGISIKGDRTGETDIFSFELSGIPAAVPKSVAGDLSLMFSLFSDDIAVKISSLDDDAFSICEETSDSGNELIEVFFLENGISYTVVYDRHSGIPYSIDAGNDRISVSIIISDFQKTATE